MLAGTHSSKTMQDKTGEVSWPLGVVCGVGGGRAAAAQRRGGAARGDGTSVERGGSAAAAAVYEALLGAVSLLGVCSALLRWAAEGVWSRR